MHFIPYLNFDGNCREAFEAYKRIFGGKLDLMTFADMPGGGCEDNQAMAGWIMHACLTTAEGDMLMASDAPPQHSEGKMRGAHVNAAVEDVETAERVFAALSEGGQVTMPIAETFWSKRFGMVKDRFGTSWMVNVVQPCGD